MIENVQCVFALIKAEGSPADQHPKHYVVASGPALKKYWVAAGIQKKAYHLLGRIDKA